MATNQPIFLFDYFYDCYAIGVILYIVIFSFIPVPARLGRLVRGPVHCGSSTGPAHSPGRSRTYTDLPFGQTAFRWPPDSQTWAIAGFVSCVLGRCQYHPGLLGISVVHLRSLISVFLGDPTHRCPSSDSWVCSLVTLARDPRLSSKPMRLE